MTPVVSRSHSVTRLLGGVLAVVLCATLTGCGKQDGAEGGQTLPVATPAASPQTVAPVAATGVAAPAIQDISDNPAFFSAIDVAARAAAVQELDRRLRPVLKRLFKDAKLTTESSAPETRRDGEVIENRFAYTVRMLLADGDGVALHKELRSLGFVSTARLGSKPLKARGAVMMSLAKTMSQHPYSLVITVDFNRQQITVDSYRPGSKYDR